MAKRPPFEWMNTFTTIRPLAAEIMALSREAFGDAGNVFQLKWKMACDLTDIGLDACDRDEAGGIMVVVQNVAKENIRGLKRRDEVAEELKAALKTKLEAVVEVIKPQITNRRFTNLMDEVYSRGPRSPNRRGISSRTE
jgi:hypothetical protein